MIFEDDSMHKGKIIAEKEKYKVIECDTCGFKHLDPIPSYSELLEFYQKEYYKLIQMGGRAPEIRKQMGELEKAKCELEWLSHTLYSEILHVLEDNIHKKPKCLLDVGCGAGNFLKFMINAGWDVIGIEPSEDGGQVAMNSDTTIYNISLEEFSVKHPNFKSKFDAINLTNVLEHVPDPIDFLKHAKELLDVDAGIICIRVPNDFNELQIHARKKLNKDLWWVAIPDHINYFNAKSLQKLVESLGFEVFYTSADFPMELFLLMGDNYIENPEVGSHCHKKRVNFELSLPEDLRLKIYQNLANMGIGRDTMIFAKIK